jgi:iron complex transport system substrate-binding protein
MRRLIGLCAVAAALCTASWTQPRRIVSTSPSITETLFALGLGDRVVGVSQYCHYPPETSSRPRVGGYLRPNVEVIAGLKPDLVILQSEAAEAASQLERIGLPVLRIEQGNLDRTFKAFQKIGARCGVPERAAKLVADVQAKLNAVRQRTSGLPKRSLLFIVGRSPGGLENLTAVGKGSYLNELIEIAGGANVLAGSPLPYLKVSLEAVMGLNPDVLVDMGDMSETLGVTEEHKRSVVALWSRQPGLRAVARHTVFAVASDIFVVPGPRVVDAAEAFEKMLHPESTR